MTQRNRRGRETDQTPRTGDGDATDATQTDADKLETTNANRNSTRLDANSIRRRIRNKLDRNATIPRRNNKETRERSEGGKHAQVLWRHYAEPAMRHLEDLWSFHPRVLANSDEAEFARAFAAPVRTRISLIHSLVTLNPHYTHLPAGPTCPLGSPGSPSSAPTRPPRSIPPM